jgi:hypothetical protein
MSMKNYNDIIGNLIRELLAFSAVPQPTAPPGGPNLSVTKSNCRVAAIFVILDNTSLFIT